MDRPHLFLGTHHKSGTVWMITVFRRIASRNGFAFVHLNHGERAWELRDDALAHFEARRAVVEGERPDRPAIFVNYHSDIPDLSRCVSERGARGIHIVRDPRDMLLSAVRYHLVSSEAWLDEPSREWDGRSFRQQLASYESLEDRIRFEIDTHMGWTINRMAGFDDQGVFRRVRYEDLIVDHEMTLWRSLMEGMGLRAEQLDGALDAFWVSSIFGEAPGKDVKTIKSHVLDGRPAQWRTQLPASSVELIQDVFSAQIEALGYELAG